MAHAAYPEMLLRHAHVVSLWFPLRQELCHGCGEPVHEDHRFPVLHRLFEFPDLCP